MAEASTKTVKGSQNYVWFTTDSLGRGAMGNVYVGRNRRKGDKYAVKVFNPEVRMMRKDFIKIELDMLQSVPEHDYIVRVLAVEEETYSKDKVVIMELCEGGSLQQILGKPENYYGLQEEEFLLVLFHIGSALCHLHQHRIVHRDIKPGNILLCILPDGSHVYKLTDFGAGTSTTEEDSGFKSMCGTEEYLHPDMHRAAFVSRRHDVTYDETVDQWSFGITIYQCATGNMAFQPKGGIRLKKHKMQELMRNKVPGVISQTEKPDGSIEKRRELPDRCCLTSGTKRMVEDILRKLFDLENRPKADEFFVELHYFSQQIKCYVFLLECSALITVYVNRDNTIMHLREEIAKQTEIPAGSQTLLFGDSLLENCLPDSGTTKISDYPESSREKPILLTTDAECSASIKSCSTIELPHLPENVRDPDLHNDAKWAKGACGTVFFMLFIISGCYVEQQQMLNMRNAFSNHLDQMCRELHPCISKFEAIIRVYINMYETSRQFASTNGTSKALASAGDLLQGCKDRLEKLQGSLQTWQEHIKDLRNSARKQSNLKCGTDRCIQSGEKMVAEANGIYGKLLDDQKKALDHNGMEIHKFHKSELRRFCRRIRELASRHCFKESLLLWDETKDHMSKMKIIMEQLHSMSDDIAQFDQDQLKKLESEMTKAVTSHIFGSKGRAEQSSESSSSKQTNELPDKVCEQQLKSTDVCSMKNNGDSSSESDFQQYSLGSIDLGTSSTSMDSRSRYSSIPLPRSLSMYESSHVTSGYMDSAMDDMNCPDKPTSLGGLAGRSMRDVGLLYNCDEPDANVSMVCPTKHNTDNGVTTHEQCIASQARQVVCDIPGTDGSKHYKATAQPYDKLSPNMAEHGKVNSKCEGQSTQKNTARYLETIPEELKNLRRNLSRMDMQLQTNMTYLRNAEAMFSKKVYR